MFEEENAVREVYSKFMDIEREDLKFLSIGFNRLKDKEQL